MEVKTEVFSHFECVKYVSIFSLNDVKSVCGLFAKGLCMRVLK